MPTTDVTLLLGRLGGDDAHAEEARAQLFRVVYDELRTLARAQLRTERDGHTLGATDLVHEAFLRLTAGAGVAPADRRHFFATAAQAMRRILVDWARAHRAGKRGGGAAALSLDALRDGGLDVPADARADFLLALDEALERLAALDPRKARVIECRYIAGLSVDETADVLGVSGTTVKTDWAFARAWLARELGNG